MSTMKRTVICPQCGAATLSWRQRCDSCGALLHEDELGLRTRQRKTKKGQWIWQWVTIALFACVAVGLLSYILIDSDNSSTLSSEEQEKFTPEILEEEAGEGLYLIDTTKPLDISQLPYSESAIHWAINFQALIKEIDEGIDTYKLIVVPFYNWGTGDWKIGDRDIELIIDEDAKVLERFSGSRQEADFEIFEVGDHLQLYISWTKNNGFSESRVTIVALGRGDIEKLLSLEKAILDMPWGTAIGGIIDNIDKAKRVLTVNTGKDGLVLEVGEETLVRLIPRFGEIRYVEFEEIRIGDNVTIYLKFIEGELRVTKIEIMRE